MKIFRLFLKGLLGIFLVVNLLLAFHAYRFTYFYDNPEGIKPKRPEEMSFGEKAQNALFGIKFLKRAIDTLPGRPYQTVELSTNDGETLEAWYVPSDSARGTVLMFHGHSSSKAKIMAEAEYFHQLGFHTLLVDFRAHGNSSGNVCAFGTHESADVKAAYDFVVQQGERNIVLWGVSMGAATVLRAVPEYDLKPQRIVLECPFASLYDAVKGRLRTLHVPESPFAELLMFWGSVERGMWAFGYAPAQDAQQITCPTLLNWGAQDPRVLRHETDQIFGNLGTNAKQLVVFEESAHQSFCVKEPQKWKQVMSDFLSK